MSPTRLFRKDEAAACFDALETHARGRSAHCHHRRAIITRRRIREPLSGICQILWRDLIAELLAEEKHTAALLEGKRLCSWQAEDAVTVGEALGEAHRPQRWAVHRERLGPSVHGKGFARHAAAWRMLGCIQGVRCLQDASGSFAPQQYARGLLD